MGQIYLEIGDLSYEVLYTESIWGDDGDYDTPPYYEWDWEIDEITLHGEYGDGQDVFLSDLPQEHQDEINDCIDGKIGETI